MVTMCVCVCVCVFPHHGVVPNNQKPGLAFLLSISSKVSKFGIIRSPPSPPLFLGKVSYDMMRFPLVELFEYR